MQKIGEGESGKKALLLTKNRGWRLI